MFKSHTVRHSFAVKIFTVWYRKSYCEL